MKDYRMTTAMTKVITSLFLFFTLSVSAVVTPTVTITDFPGYLIVTESNTASVTIAKPFTVIAEPADVILRDEFTSQKVVYLVRLRGWTFTSSADLQAQLMALNPAGTQTLSISSNTLSISGGNYVILPTSTGSSTVSITGGNGISVSGSGSVYTISISSAYAGQPSIVTTGTLNGLSVRSTAIFTESLTIGGLKYRYPSIRGAANTVLTEDGSGNLDFLGFTGMTIGGSQGDIQFNNSGVLDGSAFMNYDGTHLNINGYSNSPNTIMNIQRSDYANGSLLYLQRAENSYTYWDFHGYDANDISFEMAAGGGGTAISFRPYSGSLIKCFSSNPALQLYNNSGGTQLQTTSNGSTIGFQIDYDGNPGLIRGVPHSWYSSNATGFLYNDGSGNISLQSAGGISDAPSDGTIYGRQNGNWVGVYGGGGNMNGSTNSQYIPYSSSSNYLQDSPMQVYGSNIGINTTPYSYPLEVNGSGYFNGDIYLGTCGNWLSSITGCSDSLFKKDVENVPSVLAKIMQMRPVIHKWKASEFPQYHFDNNKEYGFIAQEVERLFPELINKNTSNHRFIDYQKITVVLLKAIQEQQSQIILLKQDVEILKNK